MKSFEYYLAQQEKAAHSNRWQMSRRRADRRMTREEKRLEWKVAAVMSATAAVCAGLAALALAVTLSGCAKGVDAAESPVPSEAVSATIVEVAVERVPEASHMTEVVEPTPEPTPAVYIYDVPLDADLQFHIIRLCDDYHIDPAIVMAMIERESRFKPGAVGDGGESFGLMQINLKYHRERMEKLGVSDLLDPHQNVMVGIDYLAELVLRHEDIEVSLMAYNAGEGGANRYWWRHGIYSNAYSSGVLERSRTFREGMVEHG